MDRFAMTFTVRWAECDANGHMRNTAYSEYGTDVRVGYLDAHGWGFEQFRGSGFGPVLLREELDYLRELTMNSVVEVDLKVLGLTADGSRFKIAHDFTRSDGRPCARVVVEGGWMDMRTRRIAPPPEGLARAFAEAPRGEGYAEIPPRRR